MLSLRTGFARTFARRSAGQVQALRSYAAQKGAATDAKDAEKNIAGKTETGAAAKPGYEGQIDAQSKGAKPGAQELKKEEDIVSEGKTAPRDQVQGEEVNANPIKGGPGSTAPPNMGQVH